MDPVRRAREFVENLPDVPGAHDKEHTRRVVRYARILWEKEGGDWGVIGAAAWLHDASLLLGGSRETHHEDSAKIALELLGDERVAQAIREHRFSLGTKPSSLESAILQDADRLDVLGPMALYRIFSNTPIKPLYHPEDPFALERELTYGDYCVDHIFSKILRAPDLMNTETAREMARGMNRVVYLFLEELERVLGREGELDRALKRHGLPTQP